jgi:hypothetical protein
MLLYFLSSLLPRQLFLTFTIEAGRLLDLAFLLPSLIIRVDGVDDQVIDLRTRFRKGREAQERKNTNLFKIWEVPKVSGNNQGRDSREETS